MASRPGAGNAKVVLLGEGCVGKTCIVMRYVENKFNDKHDMTLQVCDANTDCSTCIEYRKMTRTLECQLYFNESIFFSPLFTCTAGIIFYEARQHQW